MLQHEQDSLLYNGDYNYYNIASWNKVSNNIYITDTTTDTVLQLQKWSQHEINLEQ
jgi:hypothetical protein